MDCCLKEWTTSDLDLSKINDNYWKAFVEYGEQGGGVNGTDPWGGGGRARWIESNPTPLVDPKYVSEFSNLPSNSSDILIYQPCNTVSNLAYYKTMVAICETNRQWTFSEDTRRTLVRSALPLGIGSVYFHGSQTALGYWFDISGTSQYFWTGHQAMLQAIPYQSILHDLAEKPSQFSAMTLVANISKIVQDMPVSSWFEAVTVSKDWEGPR